jgi:hypothetical protein
VKSAPAMCLSTGLTRDRAATWPMSNVPAGVSANGQLGEVDAGEAPKTPTHGSVERWKLLWSAISWGVKPPGWVMSPPGGELSGACVLVGMGRRPSEKKENTPRCFRAEGCSDASLCHMGREKEKDWRRFGSLRHHFRAYSRSEHIGLLRAVNPFRGRI